MKKTVSTNISGIIFNMDEDAYEKLQRYLETIRSYFKNSEGCDEIMADIEARIAEMFSEKVSASKQVITLAGVDEVIATLGQPEDYIDGEPAAEPAEEEPKQQKQQRSAKGNRRIYRDPDSKVLGGVCSGLGYWFGMDPLWLRIAFVVLFFVGWGILVYIILWLIIPKAKTTAEKLEMKGEPVNVSNIGKAVEEEMSNVKQRMNDMADDIKNSDLGRNTKSALEKFFDFIMQLFFFLIKAIGKILGTVFIIAGAMVLTVFLYTLVSEDATIASWTSDGWIPFSFPELMTVLFPTGEQVFLATVGLLLVIGIPLVSLIYSGIKLLFGIRNDLKIAGILLTSLWLAGIVMGAMAVFPLSADFSARGETEVTVEIAQPAGDTLFLAPGKDIFEARQVHYGFIPDRDVPLIELAEKGDSGRICFGNPRLDIVRSETDSFEIVYVKAANGAGKRKALERARNIACGWSQQDSLLQFNPWYEVPETDKWRSQELDIIVKVPQGRAVHLGDGLHPMLFDVKNVTNTWDRDMCGKTWTMLPEGLTCVGCPQEEL